MRTYCPAQTHSVLLVIQGWLAALNRIPSLALPSVKQASFLALRSASTVGPYKRTKNSSFLMSPIKIGNRTLRKPD